MANDVLPDREAVRNRPQQRGRGNQQDLSEVRDAVQRVDDEATREALLAILSELEGGRGQPENGANRRRE